MCLLTGELYTARDAAHKRLCALLEAGSPCRLICAARSSILSARRRQSRAGNRFGRADDLLPHGHLQPGAAATGPDRHDRQGGKRSEAVIEAIRACGAVYFGATGGCGALLSRCIKKAEIIAYPDLGPEAVRRLYVENFPVTVIIDSEGNNLYEIGRQNYLNSMRQREACGSGV